MGIEVKNFKGGGGTRPQKFEFPVNAINPHMKAEQPVKSVKKTIAKKVTFTSSFHYNEEGFEAPLIYISYKFHSNFPK